MDDLTKDESTSRTPADGRFARISGYVANGLRYWEPRRAIYNLVLGGVVLVHFAVAWPASAAKLSVDMVLGLFLLAVVANVCYCAVYLADTFVQLSGLESALRRGRTALLIVGTAFAATIAHFVAQGVFGG